jgi:DNA-binding NtrC family response regulator
MNIALITTQQTLYAALKASLGANFEIHQIQSQYSVEQFLSADAFDIAILDLNSAIGSLEVRRELARTYINAGVSLILLADDTMRTSASDLVKEGAYGYCRVPLHVAEMKAMLRRAHETTELKRELRATQKKLEHNTACDQMIGSSPQMRQVYSLIHRVANFDNNVLVTGESGTGKELIARAIHNLGDRAGRPFVAVSCGAIPETLIESELFGHDKGAFTGSTGNRAGLLEQAGDGTVFLDEIGELSPFTQVKLLRVLQQKEFMRLGGSRLIPLKARLIFATHRHLDEMVARGQFRQDLYYRINVVKIEAPPLRERAEDISRIALHFLMQYSEAYQKSIDDIDPAAMSQLMSYSWPGNVRELENVIQRAVLLSTGNKLTVEDLPEHLRDESAIDLVEDQLSGSFERQLRDYKVKLAEAAIRENGGNKTLAARSLNISRAYLHRLIRLTDNNEPEQMDEPENRNSVIIM